MTSATTPGPAAPPRRRGAVLAVALILSLVVMAVGVVPFRQIMGQRRAVEAERQRLELLQQENRRLTEEVAALQTPAEIERRAREDFGFVRPGDNAFRLVQPEGQDAPAPAVQPERDQGLLGSLFDFVTGRDLVPDG